MIHVIRTIERQMVYLLIRSPNLLLMYSANAKDRLFTVKMQIADWPPYSSPFYINIGLRLRIRVATIGFILEYAQFSEFTVQRLSVMISRKSTRAQNTEFNV